MNELLSKMLEAVQANEETILDKMVCKTFGVGKRMSPNVYIHKQYENVLPQESLNKAKELLPKDFNYTIVKYNKKNNNNISFIICENFDTEHEPVVGDSFFIDIKANKGRLKRAGKRKQIYHHKWQFVKPTYKGFSYKASRQRSLGWFKKFQYDSLKIGWKDVWDSYNVDDFIKRNKK